MATVDIITMVETVTLEGIMQGMATAADILAGGSTMGMEVVILKSMFILMVEDIIIHIREAMEIVVGYIFICGVICSSE